MRVNLVTSQRYVLVIGTIALLCFLSGYLAALSQFTFDNSYWLPFKAGLLLAFVGLSLAVVRVSAARQRIEDQLKEREARLRGMFEGAAIGIGLDDFQGRIVESNPALQRMLGYSKDELSGITFAEFTHPDDVATDLELFEEMMSGRRDSYQLEKRHIRKDGQQVWVRLTNSLVRDKAGRPKFTIGMVEDITERKQAEAALQQSEARFRVVAETAACAVMVYQGEHFRYVNPATETISGYTREELLAKPFWELVHPDMREMIRERGLARQRGERVPPRYELRIITKSGQERWLDFTAGAITFEGQPAAMATAYDVTDRKIAEMQLKVSAERERLLAEIALKIRRSLDIQEILDTTVEEIRRFLQTDRVFITHLEPTGCLPTVAESVDPRWDSALECDATVEDIEEIKSLFTQESIRVVNDTAQGEHPPIMREYYDRFQVRASLGVPLYLDGSMFGLLIANQCSAPRRWQSFEIDLFEKLATQVEIAIQQAQLYQQVKSLANSLECQVEDRTAELHQRMSELHQSNQVKDLLLHAVAHDLKTPIQGMVMVLNNLQNKCCEEKVTISRSMLDRMIQSSTHQLTLLNSLLQDHTNHEPHLKLDRQSLSVSAVVESILQNDKERLTQNQVTVVNRIPPELPLVWADADRLHQVFGSLLCNAIKHNPPGLTVSFSARVMEDAGMLYCYVEDTGVGMTPEQCDRLFYLYPRGVDNCHLTGIGMGLYRCRQIVQAHGGQIGVTSQPGVGTKIWLSLPLAEPLSDGSSQTLGRVVN